MKKIFGITLFYLILLSAHAQQLNIPLPSPTQELKQDFGLSNIELSYSRPSIKGRQIFGGLVPFGKVWRTGANSATTITFGDDVTIAGTKVPAGKYGLVTIPGPTDWTIIISKQLDVTNPAVYKEENDVVRATVAAVTLPFPVETFTILFGNLTASRCDLQLVWDSTFVELPIETDVESKVMKQIDNVMNVDNKPYYSAAYYYLENGKDLNKAVEWFDKAAAQNPNAYWVHYQRARALAKLGKKAEALAASNKSMELAKSAKNDDYIALNEEFQKRLK